MLHADDTMEKDLSGNLFPAPGLTGIPMQKSVYCASTLIMCVFVFFAGCTSVTAAKDPVPPDPISTTPAENISLAPFALTTADMPAGSIILSGRQKSADEVNPVAHDLGWKQGYVIVGSLPSDTTTIPIILTQTLTVYPEDKIAGIVSLINTNERQQYGLEFSDLPLPATGPNTYSISAVVSNNTAEPVASGEGIIGSYGKSTDTPAQGYIEVIFYKGDILEVIRLSGPGANYTTLNLLSETAYAKL